MTSAERGETVTAEICFSAAGVYVPPMLIFPRKRMNPAFQVGLPPAALVACSDSGWINKELFLKWFKHFVAFSGASPENPVLLILDGHSTHTKNIDLIDKTQKSGVILFCLPPHCSHKLQPLDIAFMKPLSKYYGDEIRKFLRNNPGKVATLAHISSLFGPAYTKAALMTTAINGFEKTGISPLNSDIFGEVDFLASSTTDIELPSEEQEMSQHLPSKDCARYEASASTVECSSNTKRFSPLRNSFQVVSPEEVMPIPKVVGGKKRVSRRRGKTAVLTSSPYKRKLLEEISNKNLKEKKTSTPTELQATPKRGRGRPKLNVPTVVARGRGRPPKFPK